jgi:hypothetical protein
MHEHPLGLAAIGPDSIERAVVVLPPLVQKPDALSVSRPANPGHIDFPDDIRTRDAVASDDVELGPGRAVLSHRVARHEEGVGDPRTIGRYGHRSGRLELCDIEGSETVGGENGGGWKKDDGEEERCVFPHVTLRVTN